MQAVVGDAVAVAVPRVLEVSAAGVELDEADAALEQPAGDEALTAEISGERPVEAVALARALVLTRDVYRFACAGLHAEGELVGFDPRRQLGIAGPRL